jgi:hypothetical protein
MRFGCCCEVDHPAQLEYKTYATMSANTCCLSIRVNISIINGKIIVHPSTIHNLFRVLESVWKRK